jgi:L-seryl-tRNA(Ser) seleniumtransferase
VSVTVDDDQRREQLRALPSIDELLVRPSLASVLAMHSRPLAVRALREAVSAVRERVLQGQVAAFDDAEVVAALGRLTSPNLRRVINATGVVLHTNLGRAPLATRALERLVEIGRGACNLELDLDEGERGSRYDPVVELLCELTGAEDAMVVNNCAAAVLLSFGALAQGREAIVSRGELVEIGGGFRIPDVMRQSGATLVEVGTTNRTRVADYASAVTANTGLLVKVHQSNFAIVGFSEAASVAELSALARERRVPLFVDLGSGALRDLHAEGLTHEPTVASVIAAGADLVAFSGDKLLGGPQSGLLVGRRSVIERLRAHPLNRALRIDKLTVAALEATLELYREGREDELVPTRALLQVPLATLRARAERGSRELQAHGVAHRVVDAEGRVGGGTMPQASLPSVALAIAGPGQALHERLRQGTPSVVGRVVDDELWLDLRCVADDDLERLVLAVAGATKEGRR